MVFNLWYAKHEMRNKAWFCESSLSDIPNRWRCSWWILWCLAAWLCLASNSIEWLIPPDAGKNITRCFRCKYPEYSWISSPTQKWPNSIIWIIWTIRWYGPEKVNLETLLRNKINFDIRLWSWKHKSTWKRYH